MAGRLLFGRPVFPSSLRMVVLRLTVRLLLSATAVAVIAIFGFAHRMLSKPSFLADDRGTHALLTIRQQISMRERMTHTDAASIRDAITHAENPEALTASELTRHAKDAAARERKLDIAHGSDAQTDGPQPGQACYLFFLNSGNRQLSAIILIVVSETGGQVATLPTAVDTHSRPSSGDCVHYCRRMLRLCAGENSRFNSRKHCLTECAKFDGSSRG